jgi:FkbM family methyltransferase
MRVATTALLCAACYFYAENKNPLPPRPLLSSIMTKEKEKFIVNCSAFHSKYGTGTGNFVHVPSSITGGSDFTMSVHDPEKEVISMAIKKHGCFECNILSSLMSALKNSKNATLIDIGGNIGMYSLHAASHGRNAIAFEPLKINQEKLCQSTLLNHGFGEKIQIVSRALTNINLTYVDFNTEQFDKAVFKRNRGQKNYGVMKTGAGLDKKPYGVLGKDYALATTIDSMQSLHILPPPGSHVVLKVDVEGSECRALTGAAEYLHKLKIEYVALEMTPDRIESCRSSGAWDYIYNLFLDNGLEPYKFDDQAKGWVEINNWQDLKLSGFADLAFSAGPPSNI